MPKRQHEERSIRVTRIDCEDGGVKSRSVVYITPTYASKQLGLSAEWIAANKETGV